MALKTLTAALVAVLACALQAAAAAELRVLSAGAVEPGIRPALAAFEKASGHTVTLSFATAPQIRERTQPGAAPFDLVIAPPGVLDELESAAKLDADRTRRVSIGRVGLGVAVRPGAPLPDISTPEAFRRSVVEADSLVFNRASTGLYVETLLQRLGVDAQGRSTRYPDGAAVMAHVLRGQGRELGLGAITEILLLRDQGLQFVGPLPPTLQNFTLYVAAPARGLAGAPAEAVRDLLTHLASAPSQALFANAGIAPVR
jgi:molybdate transport system substrate-binding protein